MRYYIDENFTVGKLRNGEIFDAFNNIHEVDDKDVDSLTVQTFFNKEVCIISYIDSLLYDIEHVNRSKWNNGNPIEVLIKGFCKYVESDKCPVIEGFDWYIALVSSLNYMIQISDDFCVAASDGVKDVKEAYFEDEETSWVVCDFDMLYSTLVRVSSFLFLLPESGKVWDILYTAKILNAISKLYIFNYTHKGVDMFPMYQILRNLNIVLKNESVVKRLRQKKVKNAIAGIETSAYVYLKMLWEPIKKVYGVDLGQLYDIGELGECWGNKKELESRMLPVAMKGVNSAVWFGIDSDIRKLCRCSDEDEE